MRAVICPVCNGKGVVYGVAETGAYPTTKCHGCNSKGWVEVSGDEPFIPLETARKVFYFLDRCPACGGDRNLPGLTGCPRGSHYGTYSGVK